ncbi:ABC transporter ATP-binding protein [Clostridium intestinale]|uniref:Putative ABC transport system ATP-binding protein n=1 Tax=Clostridium intestinale DSM 6191 TaxID=1121320 RepID=A0A1M6AUT7_9CLOT|nr:ABC transporter ATP-binding protein [Clostridium intestinale]SHI40236.1 putative ABC transport system ATP-binding protein [Clostridium intestinale DSM 6191]
MKPIVEFKNVSKIYEVGDKKLMAADRVNFTIDEGEFVVILGPSGAGKSTILNLLGGMDYVTSGEIVVNGENIEGYSDNELTEFRGENIGFVFQFYNLIPTLTALENVSLIKEVVKDPLDGKEILESIGLIDHVNKFPSQLSGGEQQRVSIARALCKNPTMLLCDEPTGALDSETGVMILSLLQKMCRENKKTVIIVTHNGILTEAADKVIRVKNGKIQEIIINTSPKKISEVNW